MAIPGAVSLPVAALAAKPFPCLWPSPYLWPPWRRNRTIYIYIYVCIYTQIWAPVAIPVALPYLWPSSYLCVRMYVCMHAYMNLCMYVCMYVRNRISSGLWRTCGPPVARHSCLCGPPQLSLWPATVVSVALGLKRVADCFKCHCCNKWEMAI